MEHSQHSLEINRCNKFRSRFTYSHPHRRNLCFRTAVYNKKWGTEANRPLSPDERDGLDVIHDDLVCRHGKDAVAYSTVTKYDRSAQFSGQKEATPPEAPYVERSPVDEAVLTALAEFPFPFSSVRELSRRICLPRSIVHRHLTQSLRFTVRHL
jgi:hypothetical protein